MAVARKEVGEIMAEKGWISPSDLQQARQIQQTSRGVDIGRILLDNGLANEKDVSNARALSMNLQFIDLEERRPEPEALALVPAQVAQRHNLLFLNGSLLRFNILISLKRSKITSLIKEM